MPPPQEGSREVVGTRRWPLVEFGVLSPPSTGDGGAFWPVIEPSLERRALLL